MADVSVLIVDDHPLFRQGLLDVLEAESGVRVVGVAGDAENAVEQAREHTPDVILMDINLPAGNGLRATRAVLREMPATKIIVLTGYDDIEQMARAMRAGAVGYCTKDIPPEELMSAIEAVHGGRFVLDGQVMSAEEAADWVERHSDGRPSAPDADDAYGSLTDREREILELVARGAGNMDIALELHISTQTVKNHLTAIFRKLGVADRTQAAIFALQHGWVPSDPSAGLAGSVDDVSPSDLTSSTVEE